MGPLCWLAPALHAPGGLYLAGCWDDDMWLWLDDEEVWWDAPPLTPLCGWPLVVPAASCAAFMACIFSVYLLNTTLGLPSSPSCEGWCVPGRGRLTPPAMLLEETEWETEGAAVCCTMDLRYLARRRLEKVPMVFRSLSACGGKREKRLQFCQTETQRKTHTTSHIQLNTIRFNW